MVRGAHKGRATFGSCFWDVQSNTGQQVVSTQGKPLSPRAERNYPSAHRYSKAQGLRRAREAQVPPNSFRDQAPSAYRAVKASRGSTCS
jgi:hypothetical protein